jgi:gluconate 2-dehydrogenase gamma chain
MRRMSRRVFVHRLTFFGGCVVLLGNGCRCGDEHKQPQQSTSKAPGIRHQHLTTSHLTFTNEEYAVVAAACERILPRDEDPGALDAHVPQYIDRMLQSHDLVQMKEDFLGGVAALDRRAQRMFQKGFASLEPSGQDEVLRAFKESPAGSGEGAFYELFIALTMEGFLGDPSYGGNQDRVGWALVGFNTMEPPPGYDGLKALHHHHMAHGGEP